MNGQVTKVFCTLFDRQIFIEQMLVDLMNLHKIKSGIYRKQYPRNSWLYIFTLMPFQSDRQTDGQNIYRNMFIYQRNLHKKNKVSILNRSREIYVSVNYIYAFCNLVDRPSNKILTEQILIDEENMHRKKTELSILINGRDIRTVGRTFVSFTTNNTYIYVISHFYPKYIITI